MFRNFYIRINYLYLIVMFDKHYNLYLADNSYIENLRCRVCMMKNEVMDKLLLSQEGDIR
jgi:hypothetical protein